MQGKIIAEGLIGETDGKRYTFTLDDLVKGTHITSVQSIIGNEVDFEVVEGKASNIYIIKSSLTNNIYITKSSLSNKILSTDLQGIKMRVYIAMACMVLTPVPFIGQVADIATAVLIFFVVWGVNTQSQSTTFKKNFIKTLVALFVAIFVFGIIFSMMNMISMIMVGTFVSTDMDNTFEYKSSLLSFFKNYLAAYALWLLISFLSGLPFWRYFYLCSKELAYITNQKMFLYAFWFCVPVVTSIIGVILSVIAWVRTQEIRKSYSALS